MNFTQLITDLRDLDGSLKSHVKQSANIGLTLRNWFVGAYIVEFEQNGDERAEYGTNLIKEVAKNLQVSGLHPTNLELCRRLFLEYPSIPQTLSVELDHTAKIRQTLSVELNSFLSQIPRVIQNSLKNRCEIQPVTHIQSRSPQTL